MPLQRMFARFIDRKNMVLTNGHADKIEESVNEETAWNIGHKYFSEDSSCEAKNVFNLATELANTVLISLTGTAMLQPSLSPVVGTIIQFYKQYQEMESNKEDFDEMRSRFAYLTMLLDSTTVIKMQSTLPQTIMHSFKAICKAVVGCTSLVHEVNNQIINSKRTNSPVPRFVERTRSTINSFLMTAEDKDKITAHINNLNAAISLFTDSISERNIKLYHIKELLQVSMTNYSGDIEGNPSEWLENEVESWFNHKPKHDRDITSKLCIIRGESGVGKSTFSRSLINAWHSKYPHRIVAYHFCQFYDSQKSSPLVVLKSLIYQFIQTFPELIDTMYPIFETLKNELQSIDTVFERLLLCALRKLELLRNPKSPKGSTEPVKEMDNMLFVIDGIDEIGIDGSVERGNLVDLLSRLVLKLPKWVRIVATGKPNIDLVSSSIHSQAHSIAIDTTDPRHLKELQVYITRDLSILLQDSSKLSSVVETLLAKCEGNYLTATRLANTISDSFTDDEVQNFNVESFISKLSAVSSGVNESFKMIIETLLKSVDKMKAIDFLLIVIAAVEPLSEEEMVSLLELTTKDSDYIKLLSLITSLIPVKVIIDDNGNTARKFVPIHKTVVEWLLNSKENSLFYCSVETGHNVVARKLLHNIGLNTAKINEGVTVETHKTVQQKVEAIYKENTTLSRYLFKHLLDHLDSLRSESRYQHVTFHLLTSLAWLQSTIELFGIPFISSEISKRLFSPLWLPDCPNERQELKLLFQFFRLIEGSAVPSQVNQSLEICSQITGRLRECSGDRLKTLVSDAEEYLAVNGGWSIHRNTPLEQPGGPLEMVLKCRDRVQSVYALNNGNIVSDSDNVVRIWNTSTGECAIELDIKASAMAVLSSGLIATCLSSNAIIILWNPSTGARELTVECSILKGVTALCALPGNLLACADTETIVILDASSSQWIYSTSDHSPTNLTALPNKKIAYVAHDHGEVHLRVYLYENGDTKSCPSIDNRPIEQICVVSDGHLIVKDSSEIRIWNAKTFVNELLVKESHPCALHSLSDGRLVIGYFDGVVKIWNVTTKEAEVTLSGHRSATYALCSLSDGRLFSCSNDLSIRVWNLTNVKQIDAKVESDRKAHVNVMCALSNGKIACGCEDTFVRIWNINGECEFVLKGHGYGVLYLVELPDGRLVSGCFYEHNIRIWNTTTGACDVVLHSDSMRYICKGFCLIKERRLASLDDCGSVYVWNCESGAVEMTIKGSGEGNCLCHLPDNRLACGQDKNIIVYNLATGATERILKGHADRVKWLYVAASGRLVSGSGDEKIRMWDFNYATSTEIKFDPFYCIDTVYSIPGGHLVVVAKVERASGSSTVINICNALTCEVESTFSSDSLLSPLVELLPFSQCCIVSGYVCHVNEFGGSVISHAVRLIDGKSYVLVTVEKNVLFVTKN